MQPRSSDSGRAGDLCALDDLTRADLIELWIELHGSPPIKTMTKGLLARGIAHEMQVRQRGDLTPTEKKALDALAQGKANPTTGNLKPGTRLYRSWQGVTHEVLVSESSYSWRGKSHASLSEVARAITGTRWSGPRFFGIKA